MASRELLTRLTLALLAVPVPLSACGGETTDGRAAPSGVTSGNGGGTGIGGSSAGGAGGAAGTAGFGGSAVCDRPLPAAVPGSSGNACRVQKDCPNSFDDCLRPGEPACSFDGDPGLPACANDAACDQGTNAFWVCQEDDVAPSFCTQACTDTTACAPSRRCDQDGHCVPRSCLGDSPPCPDGTYCSGGGTCRAKQCDAARPCGLGFSCDAEDFTCRTQQCQFDGPANGGCPDTFTCTSSPDGASCLRTSCTCDSQCGASGYCVGGACYERAGTCSGGVDCGRPLLVDGAPLLAPLLVVAWL